MFLPADPLFSGQFNLNNTGQTGGIAGIDLNVTGVWDDYTGAGVLVGIIDDGVDHTHADLIDNYDTSLDNDSRGNDSDAMAEGSDAHGTAVAGIIAADDNGLGSVGVAFDATITGFRMGYGADGTLGQITENLQLQTGVDISNNSWGFGGFFSDNFKTSSFRAHGDALETAVETGRDGLGTVWVFAAGNSRDSGDNVNYHNFQNSRFTIAVAAAEDDGDIAFYSNPGASVITTAPVAAGGGLGGVITTDRQGSAGYVSGDFVNGFNGTSAATPMVSGVVALMLEANPDLGYRDVQEILAYSSRQIDAGDAGWALNGATDWNGGGLHVSHDFGFGLTDALTAVRLAESWRDQSTFANEELVTASRAPLKTIVNDGTITDTITISDPVDLEWVEVDINVDHSWIGDLEITLTSPDGTVSTLVDRPGVTSGNQFGTSQDDIRFVLTSARHWGEDATGDWTLAITDHFAADGGTLFSWRLNLYGDAPDGNDDYVYTDEYAVFAADDAARRTLSDAGGSDRINAAALTGAALIDLNTGAQGSLAGQDFVIAQGTVIEDAIGGDGDDTLIGNGVANDLTGARGDDVLAGGAGDDTLTGGAGADLFRIAVGEGSDTITDFDVSLDSLELDGSGDIRSAEDFVLAGAQQAGGFDVTLDDGAVLSLLGVFAADLADLAISFVNAPAEQLFDIFVSGTSLDETLTGTAGLDTILGGNGSDIVDGGDGDDWLRGNGGNDDIAGGLGDDFVAGDDGDDTLDGGSGRDQVLGGAGVDSLRGGADDDRLFGGEGNDLLLGDAGDDTLQGDAGADYLKDDAGSGVLYGGLDNDTLVTGGAGDRLYGGDHDDLLLAGAGDDIAFGDAGADRIYGEDGFDFLRGDAGDDVIHGDGQDDTILGGTGHDILFGGDGGDLIDGMAGNDSIRGDAGDDRLYAGDGDDVVRGGAGDDAAFGGAGDDYLKGQGGDDQLRGEAGNDILEGGDGLDALYGGLDADKLIGGAGADILSGDEGLDSLYGGIGDDTLLGGDGADVMFGDADNDRLYGGGQDDAVYGGSGQDSLYGDAGADTLMGGDSADLLSGGGDSDRLFGEGGDDVLRGDAGADRIYGGAGDDVARGGADDDSVFGEDGADFLKGQDGNDYLNGGGGNDVLEGGQGDDLLRGEAGADRFVFQTGDGVDTVFDFEDGIDTLQIDTGGGTFEDLAIASINGHAAVTYGIADTIHLIGVQVDQVDADDFVFL